MPELLSQIRKIRNFEIPVLSESWKAKRQLSKATFAHLVKPEVDLLSQFNLHGGTKYTIDKSDGQLVFLYSLRFYQNKAIDALMEKAVAAKTKVTKEWAIQQAQEFKIKMSYIDFTATDEYIASFTKAIGSDEGRALIMHVLAGNCYFDIHSQAQIPTLQIPVAA